MERPPDARVRRDGAGVGLYSVPAGAEQSASAPRVVSFHRCGDFLNRARLELCVTLRQGATGHLRLMVGGASLDARGPGTTSFAVVLDPAEHRSGPFWVKDDAGRSNVVWLSVQPSATIAATSAEVARSDEGILGYVDLVGIIVEEKFDAVPEV